MSLILVQLYLCTLYLNCNLLKGAPTLLALTRVPCFNHHPHFPDVSAQGLITQALFLGDPEGFNSSLADCVWKRTNERASCPDPAIEIILYTNSSRAPQKVVTTLVVVQHLFRLPPLLNVSCLCKCRRAYSAGESAKLCLY